MRFLPDKAGSGEAEQLLKNAAAPSPAPLPTKPQAKPAPKPGQKIYDESQALYVTLIFFAALTLRVILLVLGPVGDSERAMYPDSYRYVELGETLITENAFARTQPEAGVVHEPLAELRSDFGQMEVKDAQGLRPEIMRTPGYPALIGAIAWLGMDINGLLILQCLLSALSVALVYGIGRVLLKRPLPALFAALIVALHPADIAAPSSVLTETLFTFMVLLGIWCVADREQRNMGSAGFGGLMIGLSVLVRPVSIFLGPAIAFWMIVTDRRPKTLLLAALMTTMSLAPGAAWMARNATVGFGYRLSSIPYINSYFYTAAYMRLAEQGGDWKSDWPAAVSSLMGELRTEMGERNAAGEDADAFATMKDLGVQAIKDNPELYGQVIKESTLKLFTDHSMEGFYRQLGLTYTPTGLRSKLMQNGFSKENVTEIFSKPTGIFALGWTGINGLLVVGMVIGTLLLMIRRHWSALFLLGGVMLYFTLATQATGLERFRLPILGVQALLAMSILAPRPPKPQKAKTPRRRWYEQDTDDSDDEPITTPTAGPLMNRQPESESESITRPL